MKKLKEISILLLLIPFFALACKSKKVASNDERSAKYAEAEPQDVFFTFLQTVQYCGGAAPPEDLIKRLATPSPLHKQNLYFVNTSKSEKEYIELYIDSHEIMTSFMPGTYDIYLNSDESLNSFVAKNPELDEKCVRKWFGRKVGSFMIDETTKTKQVIIHFDCNPCIEPAP